MLQIPKGSIRVGELIQIEENATSLLQGLLTSRGTAAILPWAGFVGQALGFIPQEFHQGIALAPCRRPAERQ